MVIEITPLDTLFFRDGKPFTMGEDIWADGMFPPPPSVIYGALRSLYFANHMDEFDDFIKSNGTNDPTKNLKIKGVYLKDIFSNFLLFPVPLDTVKSKNEGREERNKLYPLVANENKKDCFSSLNNCLLLESETDNDVETVAKGFIKQNYLKQYLKDSNNDSISFFPYEYLIQIEPKVGIRRNNLTHVSDESALYRVGMLRLENLSIIVDFENLEDIPDKGFMKLGGEGKAASYKKVENFSLLADYKPVIKDGKFKLYLASPAIFVKNGWLPGCVENGESDMIKIELKEVKLRLLAAAIGKYVTIGGFDMIKKKNGKPGWPKKMYRAVPAGSVYYFEVLQDVDEQKLIETFHNKSISDVGSNEGFGLTFMGVV